MTFCRMCGKLLQNVQFNPSEIVLCQKCADTMKGELVRVVRCKDCKYWHETIYDTPKWLPCMSVQTSGNWYCADGERKD